MVDINLIGDDKTGEEERVDDFTQTSSMDTQELAFEERTETFDTTKTAGFSQKRNYSSLIATLIIMAVIVLLGSSVYFFMFSGDETEQPDLNAFVPDDQQDVVQTEPVDDDELAQFEQGLQEDLAQFENQQQEPAAQEPKPEVIQPTTPARQPTQTVDRPRTTKPTPRATQPQPRPASGSISQVVANSKGSIQSVTGLLSSVPADLNTTLLSYTGQQVRMEFVANNTSSAQGFTNKLNQTYGANNFSVVSQNQVAANGGFLEKVLVSGRVANAAPAGNGNVRFLTVAQARDWVNKTAQQYGLQVRELNVQPTGSFDGGFRKTPILARVMGNQSGIIGFLDELSNQSANIELAKILVVSPDMVNFSDDNLILVLNMLLYEQ